MILGEDIRKRVDFHPTRRKKCRINSIDPPRNLAHILSNYTDHKEKSHFPSFRELYIYIDIFILSQSTRLAARRFLQLTRYALVTFPVAVYLWELFRSRCDSQTKSDPTAKKRPYVQFVLNLVKKSALELVARSV